MHNFLTNLALVEFFKSILLYVLVVNKLFLLSTFLTQKNGTTSTVYTINMKTVAENTLIIFL